MRGENVSRLFAELLFVGVRLVRDGAIEIAIAGKPCSYRFGLVLVFLALGLGAIEVACNNLDPPIEMIFQ